MKSQKNDCMFYNQQIHESKSANSSLTKIHNCDVLSHACSNVLLLAMLQFKKSNLKIWKVIGETNWLLTNIKQQYWCEALQMLNLHYACLCILKKQIK